MFRNKVSGKNINKHNAALSAQAELCKYKSLKLRYTFFGKQKYRSFSYRFLHFIFLDMTGGLASLG